MINELELDEIPSDTHKFWDVYPLLHAKLYHKKVCHDAILVNPAELPSDNFDTLVVRTVFARRPS
jgi:hypothetical protein